MLVFLTFLVVCFAVGVFVRDRVSSRPRTIIAAASVAVCAAYFVFRAL